MPLTELLSAALGPHFTVERELTGGGMARVVVAHDRRLDRPIQGTCRQGRRDKDHPSLAQRHFDDGWIAAAFALLFGGGYAKLASHLAPGVVLYRFKFVEPGRDLGMAFDGLSQSEIAEAAGMVEAATKDSSDGLAASADAGTLFREFGFTTENVVAAARRRTSAAFRTSSPTSSATRCATRRHWAR